MSVRFDLQLDDVHAISAEVWASFLGAGEDALGWAERALDDFDDVVCAAVSITGAGEALVALEMDPAAARAAARRMLETDDVDATDVADAVGELVNMVGGNIKSLLPSPSTLGLPTVSEGPGCSPEGGTGRGNSGTRGSEVCRADFAWDGWPLRVRVWTRGDV